MPDSLKRIGVAAGEDEVVEAVGMKTKSIATLPLPKRLGLACAQRTRELIAPAVKFLSLLADRPN